MSFASDLTGFIVLLETVLRPQTFWETHKMRSTNPKAILSWSVMVVILI